MTDILLPDPTEDLHWDDFKQPIHDYLAANAAAHPDRECVIETKPFRSFSYRQIHETSNVLAHHLLNAGIQRGDVVMLYSYRGVDLVVAIMGVLKAGATMSVIDPLYPPHRQIQYLDVARPRAIVVIKRATETAGGFSSDVTDWIANNLKLRTTVPELAIDSHGQLHGGKISGGDILDDAQAQKDQIHQFPVIGPDDVPTLSFTSGSEGKPKGVRGRHFSLPHYFPWMAQRFGLSEKDRFTMLSGIAHDPIQRDIFTPLFLGASLWVPSAEDIQNEVLAKWMAKYETTVTHLTPAMGQVLTGDATTEFPALRNAFFVGDVLIKRDVRKLQHLAPNTTVINMFGTTETQRAVSYYAVPSRNEDPEHLEKLPETIPAGKGMHRVQLLVVDRNNPNRLCGIEEPGEIYVRAAGLAEGYLEIPGEAEMTSQKFIRNWFADDEKWSAIESQRRKQANGSVPWQTQGTWKGIRDRCYRSGDLGKYTKSGDVVCTGRADNQVKIRGFRIELGEIDSNLSSHPMIRENVTVLLRPKEGSSEEPKIVSWIVPELKVWQSWLEERNLKDESSDESMTGLLKRFHLLRTEARNFLKTKVPDYAVPSLIVPLLKMPLNPNGKPDRPRLPVPENEELNAARKMAGAELSPTERQIAEIWSEVLDGISADVIQPDDEWDALGGNSLKANKMLRLVAQKIRKVSQRDLYNNRSLKDFARVVESGDHPSNGVNGVHTTVYSQNAKSLTETLPTKFRPFGGSCDTFLLTGATGFLGSYILRNILSRPNTKVVALVRRSSVPIDARVRDSCIAYGLWSDSWNNRLECIEGDLAHEHFGLEAKDWERLSNSVDAVIHNGAKVHWLEPYESLWAPNVKSTMSAIELASTGRPKRVSFVSSTAVLESDHYANVSGESSGQGISESDDLIGSETTLDGGYGQTKWASEYIMREAGRRGLEGCIVRPGYILGDSRTGICITDDFLIRMLKGSVQVGAYPSISNTINMAPVDYVAHVVVASTLHPPAQPLGVANITPHPRLSWRDFFAALTQYGWSAADETSYETFRDKLLSYVEESEKKDSIKEPFAAIELLDLLINDFPSATSDRLLNDRNTQKCLATDGAPSTSMAVTQDTLALYLAYLVKIGFMPPPDNPTATTKLPNVEVSEEQMKALRGLSGRAAAPQNK